MSQIKSGYDALRMTRKDNKRDVLTIHPETAQRIRTTTLENGAKLDNVERTAGPANLSTTQLYDRRRFIPEKSVALMVDYGKSG